MKRKLLSVFLSLSLCAGLIPTAALAAGDALGCTCETACAEGDINRDCPVCGIEGSDLALCGGDAETATPSDADPAIAVESVQAMIDALPTADELRAMTKDGQNAVYTDLQAAYDAYNALTDGQKAEVTGAEIFDQLFEVFNGMVNALTTESNVSYLDQNGTRQTASNVTVVDTSATTWSNGWYVVKSEITIDSRVTVSGTVHLILADGCNLTVNGGINVAENNSFTIYAQSTGENTMGKLSASGGYAQAGIGGGMSQNAGVITVNGGIVTATGGDGTPDYSNSGSGGAGIGGGGPGTSGTITINGGSVIATGGTSAKGAGAGIGGGGNSSNAANITISGGMVKATGGRLGAAGIGGGGNDGTLTNLSITGGWIEATGFSNAIGGGSSKPAADLSGTSNAVIVDGKTKMGQLYGSYTLIADMEIPSGYTLTIPEGSVLTIPDGVTITNRGTINGSGTINGDGTISGNQPTGNVTVSLRSASAVSVSFSGAENNSAPYGSTISITAAVTQAAAQNLLTRASKNQVDFYQGNPEDGGKKLGTATVSGSSATLSNVKLENADDLKWTPSGSPYAIYAVFGGSDILKGGTGTANLTVTKAKQTAVPDTPTQNLNVPATASTVMLNAVTGSGYGPVQYGYTTGTENEPGHWQTETAFNNLSPGTKYTFYSRYAGNDYYEPSDPSTTGLTAYTLPKITSNMLNQAVAGVEYSQTLIAETAAGTVVTWSLASNSSLPDGLTLSEGGTISGTPKEAVTGHKFTVQATANGVSDTKELSITVAKGTAVIDLDAPGEAANEFTYGDTITVSGTITASSQATAANALTALSQNQTALFLGGTQLTEPVTVNEDGKFTIKYDTANKGIEATGQEQELTVKYGGSDDLNAGEKTFTVTLNKKPVTAEVQGEITKVYDGNSDASVALGFASGAILSGDTVNISAPGAAYDDEKAGTNKTVTLGELTVSGEQANFYDVKLPEGPIYGSITESDSSLTAEADETSLTYGDTLTITVTPTPTGQSSADTILLDSRQGVELFYENTSLATAAAPDKNGAYTLTYDTAGKGIPIGEKISLTVQFYGDGSMAASSTTVAISLSAKPVTAAVDGEITRPYNQDTKVEVKFTVTEGVEAGDALNGKATGNFKDADAGESKPVTVENGAVTWIGNTEWYSITLPDNITGTIEKAQIMQPSINTAGGTKPGDTLMVDYTPTSGEKVDYQWKRGDEAIQGATANEYTIQTGDVGKKITVTVSAQVGDNNHEGSQTSAPVTPSKGSQVAPPKPEEASVTTSSITIKEIEANQETGAVVEFSIDGGKNWQTSTIFDDLSSSSEYKIIARYQETDAYNASPVSEAAVIRTDTPSSSSGYSNEIEKTEHGTVKVSHRTPEAGQKVTITAEPDEGYEVASVTVTKAGNKVVEVTDNGDGTWSFKQPSGKVTIKVEFQEIEPEPVELPFTDVPADAWYIDGVRYVYEHHIMSGTSADTFNPSGIVNRGMIVQVLYNLAGQPDVEGVSGFDDVPGDFWCADAIVWASKLGVVNGYGDGTFGPDDNMTRDQMAVILFNYARAMGYDTSARGDLSGFTDIPEGYWAEDALRWAYAEHLITGTSDTAMSPTEQASRAQIAVVMMRFVSNVAK